MATLHDKHQTGHSRVWRGNIDKNSKLEITIHLKQLKTDDFLESLMKHPSERSYLKANEIGSKFVSENKIIKLLGDFAKLHGLRVKEKDLKANYAVVTGSIEQFSNAFKVAFSICESYNGQQHLCYQGVLTIPEELEAAIVNISGLDKGLIKGERSPLIKQDLHELAHKGYSPQDIEDVYHFPENDAKGECIGLIELGGNYSISDIKKYCSLFNIPVPEIVEVGKKPAVSQSSTTQELNNLEVTMDIQLAAGLAPNSKIVIYYAHSIPEAIHLALYDNKNNPSVLSCSWAISEFDCSVAERELCDSLCYQASLKGITIVAASGDKGAYMGKKYPNVMLPASNPYVLGCGGTALNIEDSFEQVWNNHQGYASGGGYSAVYPVPSFQQYAISQYKSHYYPYGNSGRGVPDISANSAMLTGYSIVMDGKVLSTGAGTSASTPVWAALIARMNTKMGYRLGWVNNLFYQMEGSPAFNQILSGNNGLYPASYGWNPATGLGTPNGTELCEFIKGKETQKVNQSNENTDKNIKDEGDGSDTKTNPN